MRKTFPKAFLPVRCKTELVTRKQIAFSSSDNVIIVHISLRCTFDIAVRTFTIIIDIADSIFALERCSVR